MIRISRWILSKLPFPVYYGIATIIYLIMFYIAGYRKSLVMKNLKNAFPEKPEKELKKIRKAFYKHLADYMVETVANFRMQLEDFNKRCKLTNIDLLDEYYEKGINVILAPGHYGNWEWFSHMVLRLRFTCSAIYKKQSSDFFNQLIYESRGRFGLLLFQYWEAYKYLLTDKFTRPNCLYFLADQRPPRKAKVKWILFMNQYTAAFRGLESLHQKMNGVVLYVRIRKKKRGYYEVVFVPLNEPGEIGMNPDLTTRYFRELESNVREDPRFYLWSHNRWKFNPPQDVIENYEKK